MQGEACILGAVVIGRHDGVAPVPTFNIDAIAIGDTESKAAQSGSKVICAAGGTIALPDLTGGFLTVLEPSDGNWSSTVGPILSSTLTVPTVDWSEGIELALWCAEGETAWSSRWLRRNIVFRVESGALVAKPDSRIVLVPVGQSAPVSSGSDVVIEE